MEIMIKLFCELNKDLKLDLLNPKASRNVGTNIQEMFRKMIIFYIFLSEVIVYLLVVRQFFRRFFVFGELQFLYILPVCRIVFVYHLPEM